MAKIYLDPGEVFTVASNDVFVYGSEGDERTIIYAGVTGVMLDANIESVGLVGNVADYTFQQQGNALEAYLDGIKVMNLPLQEGGSEIAFADGSFEATIDSSGMKLGGANVSKVVGGETVMLEPIDSTDDLLVSALNTSVVISGIDYASLVPLNNHIVAALYDGDSWLNFQKATDSITYSFNETLPSEYSWSDTRDWQTAGIHVRNVIDDIMSLVDGVILPDMERVFDNGQIRFNMVETAQDVAAYAYYPGSGVGGDVFLGHDIGTSTSSGNIEPFGVGRSDIVHEVGHALGLTHPFEGVSVLPASADHSANTVMSYTGYRSFIPSFTGAKTGSGSQVELDYALVAPDHFMLYDIAALQAVYGPDPDYRSGEDAYIFADSPFYTTIWDAGGYDILDFSATAHFNIVDLTPGSHSHINYRDIDTQIADQQKVYRQQLNTSHWDDWVTQAFNSRSSDLYTGENALGIAWGTIIEEVIGGPAGNKITDNTVDNYLTGGAGDDLFFLGAGGFDRVNGGGGYDLVVLDKFTRDQVELGYHEDSLLLIGDDFAVQMTDIAGVLFADQLYGIA